MTTKDQAKPDTKWEVIDVHPGELTETLTIPEGTIYRTTHFEGPTPAAVAMVFVPKADAGPPRRA